MEYLDFEVEVESADGGDYDVSVVRSPAGEARGRMRFPYDRLALRNKIQSLQIALLRSGGTRRAATAEDMAVQELGSDLYRALFAGEIASRLHVSQSIARQAGRGIRIKLRISAPELLALPWEYLYDPSGGDYLSLAITTPVVRYMPIAQPVQPLEVAPPLRILAMIAGPRDLGELDAQRERQRLQMALDRLQQRGLVELEWVGGESWEDLQEALWRGPWHVFHFIGHGGFNQRRGSGVVYLTGPDGNARELSATDLGRLLGDHDPLRLAVLNSCETAQGTETDIFSSTAAALVRRGTPAVVAMQFEITDDAAIQFSRVFYAATAHGMPVDAAVAEARKSIALQVANTYEWGTPVLFMRSPDGVLFRIPRVASAPAPMEAPAPEPASPEPAPPVAPEPPPEPGPQRQPPAASPPAPQSPAAAPRPPEPPQPYHWQRPGQPTPQPQDRQAPAQPVAPPRPQDRQPPPQPQPQPHHWQPPGQPAAPPQPQQHWQRPPAAAAGVAAGPTYAVVGAPPMTRAAAGRRPSMAVVVALVVVVALIVIGLLAASLSPPPVSASLGVSVDRAAPGDSFDVYGYGFEAGEWVAVSWADGSAATGGSADGTGAFVAPMWVPDEFGPGSYVIVAQGSSSGRHVEYGFVVETDAQTQGGGVDQAVVDALCSLYRYSAEARAADEAIAAAVAAGDTQTAYFQYGVLEASAGGMHAALETLAHWQPLADVAPEFAGTLDEHLLAVQAYIDDPAADTSYVAGTFTRLDELGYQLNEVVAGYPQLEGTC